MNRWQPIALVVLLFWVAAALQVKAVQSLTIFGARPDFLLVVAVSVSVLHRPGTAAGMGGIAGFLQGVISGANLAHYVVSRAVAAFAVGHVSKLELDVRSGYVGLMAVGATIIAQVLLMIFAPQPEFWSFIQATILTALYNGVLAIPVYALLRRAFRKHMDSAL